MNTDPTTHKDTAAVLRETIDQLTARNKELNCLFAISKIIEQQNLSLEATMQQIVETLPSAWPQPENTCARIVVDDRQFTTPDFTKFAHHQTHDLVSNGQVVGSLEVYFKSSATANKQNGLLKEEEDLLAAVAQRLGKTIERRSAQAALEKSEQRFRNLVENAVTGISIVQDNQIVYQNQEQEKLMGPLPRTYVLGDYENIHPDDVEMVMQASRDIQGGKVSKLDLDFRLTSQMDEGKSSIKRLFCRVLPIEYQGRESILVNLIDMTKVMELEQLLFRQDKMASLGRVAAGIAHEIRNPLSGINIYLTAIEKMIDRPGGRPKVDQIIGQLKSASRKIESVIKKVMDFAKPGEPKFAMIQLNKPIADAMNLTAVTLRKSGIQVEKQLDEQIPFCYADANLIETVVLNFLNNAAEAMRKIDREKKIIVSSGTSGARIFIKVSDSGPGVPLDLKEKVFDPFFTTKQDGTGIGLSLCHRVASDHRGSLRVAKSRLGGAAFTFEIPIRKDGGLDD